MPVGDVEAEGLPTSIRREVDRSPVDCGEELVGVADEGGVKAVSLNIVNELERRTARQAKGVGRARLGADRRKVVHSALDLDRELAAELGVKLQDLEKVVAGEDVGAVLGFEVDALPAEARPKVGVVRRLVRLHLGPPGGPEVLSLCLGSEARNTTNQDQGEEDGADEHGPGAARHKQTPLLEGCGDLVLDGSSAHRNRIPLLALRHPCSGALDGRYLPRRRCKSDRILWREDREGEGDTRVASLSSFCCNLPNLPLKCDRLRILLFHHGDTDVRWGGW
mmetsp:Transcript_39651/g.92801  ORF Transcript_39651/g.92801 Transcript_39651/m.92801 type:complete len:279 (+) Transcript_39651:4414-5250(+)